MLGVYGPSYFISSAILWSSIQHPLASLLTAAIYVESWIIRLRPERHSNDNSNVRIKLLCWWLLYMSVYVAFVNRTLDIGPDFEAVILVFMPLVVPHELYHGRHLLAIILSVCWKEACVQGSHLWLKDGFQWTLLRSFRVSISRNMLPFPL